MIIVLSGFNGIEKLVENIYSKHEADIVISPKIGKTFYETDTIINALNSCSEIKNYSNIIEEVTMIKHGDKWTTAIMKGVEKPYVKISKLESSIIEGNCKLWQNSFHNSIIGVGLQNQIQVSSDSRFNNEVIIYGLLREEKISRTNKSVFKPAKINVTGVFNITPEFDEKYLIVPIDFARNLLNYENEINSIEIELNSEINPLSFKNKLATVLGDNYNFETQYEKNELIYKTNAAEETGGSYYRATNNKKLEAIYEEIDKLERTEVEEIRYTKYHEKYRWFVFWGLGALLLEWTLRHTLFKSALA